MKFIKAVLIVILVTLYSCGESKYPDLEDGLYANIETSAGDILLKLEFKDVPVTVGNFVSLAEGTNKRVTDSMRGKPFYNGLNFHRVMSIANGDHSDFMIQGGCPLGTGRGDPGYKFADEFPVDSVGGLLFKHDKPGVFSMANGGPNSNGSQFFITMVPKPHLDGVHTVFGNVVKGQELVNKLKKDTKIIEINIIRIGRVAKKFNAYKTFNKIFIEAEEKAKEIEKIQKEAVANFARIKDEATELSPEFLIYFSNKGEGPKPALESKIRISYAVYFTDGKLLDTNIKEIAQKFGTYNPTKDSRMGYEPFSDTYSMNAQLIQGFKEGLQEMQFGDKIVLFVPYHLAYGDQAGRGIPPKSDLIFELEMFPDK